jgi:hypothetical protein
VVLEIVSGRKCVDARLDEPMQLLLEWVRLCFKNWFINNFGLIIITRNSFKNIEFKYELDDDAGLESNTIQKQSSFGYC